jgi:hypothetical protein
LPFAAAVLVLGAFAGFFAMIVPLDRSLPPAALYDSAE